MQIDSLNPQKIFFIKEVKGRYKTVYDALIVYKRISSPYTPANDVYTCNAYYIDNHTLWTKETKHGTPRTATKHEALLYQNYLQQITGQPQYIYKGTYDEIVNWEKENLTLSGPLPLSEHAIIETIETTDYTMLQDVFDAISFMQPPNAITLIRNIRGILINGTPTVTLTNVILDEKEHRILYTLNGKFFNGKQELPHDYMPYYMKTLTPPPFFQTAHGTLLPVTITPEQLEQIRTSLATRKLQGSKKRKRSD